LISLSLFKSIGFIIIPIATSISTWLGVIVYFILLKKNKSLFINKILLKNILKILFSAILMSLILLLGLDIFQENLDYANKFKSIYLLFIVSFVATIYLISCYLLGVLKIKNYKIK
jgi:putative peptidoglycan lipid II flippase